MMCPECGQPMSRFEAAFLSRQEDEFTVWPGACCCIPCDIYVIHRGPPVPKDMDPESYREGLRMGINHYSKGEKREKEEKEEERLKGKGGLARIQSIFDAQTYLVNLEDDRDGQQVAIVAQVPFLNRAVVIAVAKTADMKSGQGAIKGLSSELEKDFLQRVAPKGRGKKG